MIMKSLIKLFPTCLPTGLTVADPDAFWRDTRRVPVVYKCM